MTSVYLILICLTSRVAVFFDVPNGVFLLQDFVRDNFMLLEAPVWQLPSRELERRARVHVN